MVLVFGEMFSYVNTARLDLISKKKTLELVHSWWVRSSEDSSLCSASGCSGHVVGQRHPRPRERRSGRDQSCWGWGRERLPPDHELPKQRSRRENMWPDRRAAWWICWPGTEGPTHPVSVRCSHVYSRRHTFVFSLKCSAASQKEYVSAVFHFALFYCNPVSVCLMLTARWRSPRLPADHWSRTSSTMMWAETFDR